MLLKIYILIILSLLTRFIQAAEAGSNAYIVNDIAGSKIYVHVNYSEIKADEKNVSLEILKKRNELVRRGQRDAALDLYADGESRKTAEDDYSDWEKVVKESKRYEPKYSSSISADDYTFIYFNLKEIGANDDGIPWFEAVQKIGDKYKINKEVGMDSFLTMAGNLIEPKNKDKKINVSNVKGICINVMYGAEILDKRMNPGDPIKDKSSYIWIEVSPIVNSVKLADCGTSKEISEETKQKLKKIVEGKSNATDPRSAIHPMYEQLRLRHASYSVIGKLSVPKGEVILVQSNAGGRCFFISSVETDLVRTDPIQDLLNYGSIPELTAEYLSLLAR